MAKTCIRCLNDTSVRGIRFNDEGLCNFCEAYLRDRRTLTDYPKLEELFRSRVDRIKGRHAYDAAVGISGGKDSVFVLYELKHRYNLHIKAFTMNNGFLSDEARANIDRIVEELRVEHEYIEFDPDLLKRFYAYSVKKWLVPCVACSYIGYASMINFASKIDAGMIVHGRSPEQMFRLYGEDVFSELVEAGLTPIEELDLASLYTGLLGRIDEKLDKNLREDVKKMLFEDIRGDDFREFVAYFLYHPYNEDEIVRFLKQNTSWRVGEHYNHYDCRIHPATKYIYQRAEGRPHILPEVSFLVRDGQLSVEDAKKKLEGEILESKPEAEMKELFDYIGKPQGTTLLKAELYKRVISKWK
ncbi:hypothetical protein [Filifactor villosus]|uniref:N-acetyl sugar amidotransferase n=1 Tax=Filifactor villosus TaxID=29374 RepID=A0ABV9QI44_9FIRM